MLSRWRSVMVPTMCQWLRVIYHIKRPSIVTLQWAIKPTKKCVGLEELLIIVITKCLLKCVPSYFQEFTLSMWLCVYNFPSRSRGYRNFGPRRTSGGFSQWLLDRSVSISGAAAAGPRPMVVLSDVQVPTVLLLQKLCVHAVSFLVCLFLWL